MSRIVGCELVTVDGQPLKVFLAKNRVNVNLPSLANGIPVEQYYCDRFGQIDNVVTDDEINSVDFDMIDSLRIDGMRSRLAGCYETRRDFRCGRRYGRPPEQKPRYKSRYRGTHRTLQIFPEDVV